MEDKPRHQGITLHRQTDIPATENEQTKEYMSASIKTQQQKIGFLNHQ